MNDIATLKKRRADALKAAKREALHSKVDDVERELVAEREQRATLASKSLELRAKIDRLSAMSAELIGDRKKYEAFVSMNRDQYEKRHQCLGEEGLLDFMGGEGSDSVGRTVRGPHFRRTGYTTKYDNTRVLGPCERLLTVQRQQRVDKSLDANEVATRRAVSTLPPASDEGSAATPGAAGVATTNASSNATANRRVKTSSVLQHLNYHGFPSLYLRDLEQFRGYSSRRTRYYPDYMGNLISMDPCDWPSHSDFVLIGL